MTRKEPGDSQTFRNEVAERSGRHPNGKKGAVEELVLGWQGHSVVHDVQMATETVTHSIMLWSRADAFLKPCVETLQALLRQYFSCTVHMNDQNPDLPADTRRSALDHCVASMSGAAEDGGNIGATGLESDHSTQLGRKHPPIKTDRGPGTAGWTAS